MITSGTNGLKRTSQEMTSKHTQCKISMASHLHKDTESLHREILVLQDGINNDTASNNDMQTNVCNEKRVCNKYFFSINAMKL